MAERVIKVKCARDSYVWIPLQDLTDPNIVAKYRDIAAKFVDICEKFASCPENCALRKYSESEIATIRKAAREENPELITKP